MAGAGECGFHASRGRELIRMADANRSGMRFEWQDPAPEWKAARRRITMKTAKRRAAKTAAKTFRASRSWLEQPAVEMALRVGTVLMICTATALVLIHLNVYFGALPSPGPTLARPSACFLARC
jgi:hypothetical protein